MRRHPWLTAAIVFFVLSVVVFFCLEWRAEKRWQRYTAEARARGVKLMLVDYAQPPVPDEQNFAALPMLRKAFSNADATPAFAVPQATSNGAKKLNHGTPWEIWPPFGDAQEQKAIDWGQWQHLFQEWGFLSDLTNQPAADVLRGLEHFAPEFQEWRQWQVRPYCRFPFDLTKPAELNHPCIELFRGATMMFALRMRAHLAVGDSPAAYADFQDGLQVYRALREQPSLISGLLRMMFLARLVSVVDDGLRNRAWADTECRKIEADLGQIRLWDDWVFTLSTARAGENTFQESWLKMPPRKRQKLLALGRSKFESNVVSFIPREWIRDSQLRANRYIDELIARVDLAQQTLDPNGKTPSSPPKSFSNFDRYRYYFYYPHGGRYESFQQNCVSVVTALDQTRLVCALEEFRARHQAYPEKLEELVPEFLPKLPMDVYGHAPYRYQRVAGTVFRLYGFMFNGPDDGGQNLPGGN